MTFHSAHFGLCIFSVAPNGILSPLQCVKLMVMIDFLQIILQASPRVKHFGIHRKQLPLEPSVLLREANRRRASLSAGNMSEIFDGRPGFVDG